MENLELRKDNEWIIIDSEPCKVIEFIPLASVIDGIVSTYSKTTSYASDARACFYPPFVL